jgi:hypothetical protein
MKFFDAPYYYNASQTPFFGNFWGWEEIRELFWTQRAQNIPKRNLAMQNGSGAWSILKIQFIQKRQVFHA